MDAGQFAQLLETLSRSLADNQRSLVEQVLANTPGTSDSTDKPINITPFENYSPKIEKFTHYIERFENYLAVKNISDPIKKSQLLNVSIGASHYNNLNAFLGPDKPLKEMTYQDLVSNFTRMLSPVKNVVVSQHYFLSCYQKEDQSIAEYVQSLQGHISDCDFYATCTCKKKIAISDIFIRAQFVRGIRDNWIREQLLQSETKNFDDLMTKAVALEASKLQSKELTTQNQKETVDTISSHSDINVLARNYKKERYQGEPSQYRTQHRRNSRSQTDYKTLGIKDLCFRCGKNSHKIKTCNIKREDAKCTSCHKFGHVAKICIQTLTKQQQSSTKQLTGPSDCSSSSSECESEYIQNINSVNKATPQIIDLFKIRQDLGKYIIEVKIEGNSINMEVDSGAKYSIISQNTLRRLNLENKLKPTNISSRAFSHDIVPCQGKIKVTVQYKNRTIKGELYVVGSGPDSLIGRQWIRALNLELREIDAKKSAECHLTVADPLPVKVEDILSEFSNIFEPKIGCVPKVKISLTLRPHAKPTFTKERNVPYALREKVEKELDMLQEAKIITPVATSDWGSPLVVIPKADGGVRLCVDYKCGVNERLVTASFPVKRIEDILSNLRDSTYFCKLDLYKAYLHLPVDEESSAIQTITTHRGTYRMNRLSFGIKTAPSEFNRIIDQILSDIPYCDSYFDDIIVHGRTKEDCAKHLRACLQRLSEYDLHLNKNKCEFFAMEISYLGHIIKENKIMKCPEKIKAVSKMTQPTNV